MIVPQPRTRCGANWRRVALLVAMTLLFPALTLYLRKFEEEVLANVPSNASQQTPKNLVLFANATLNVEEAKKLQFEVPQNPACPIVDAVYLWVNGTDPLVSERIKNYVPDYVDEGRLRDVPTLKYSFRSLFSYAPFIRHLILVTNGQKPNWLNTSSPRLRIVTHEEIFEDKDFLPTFNSNAIESQLVNIPGIAPCFFYLNDDFFFGRPVRIEDWIDFETGKQKLFFNNYVAPHTRRMEKVLYDASVAYSNLILGRLYHPELVTNRTSIKRPPVRYYYEAHNARLIQLRYLKHLHTKFHEDFRETASRRLRYENDTALPFLYYNFVLEEYGGLPFFPLNVSNASMKYSRFTLNAHNVETVIFYNVKHNFIAWCLNDQAGKIETVKDSMKYNASCDALERVLSEHFPLPSEVENVEPGQQLIPRSLEEYQLLYGWHTPPIKTPRPSVVIPSLWICVVIYLMISVVVISRNNVQKIKL